MEITNNIKLKQARINKLREAIYKEARQLGASSMDRMNTLAIRLGLLRTIERYSTSEMVVI